jgi:hypothetical protein
MEQKPSISMSPGDPFEQKPSIAMSPGDPFEQKPSVSMSPKASEMTIINKVTIDFPDAIRAIREGRKVTKLEWGDFKIYLTLVDGRLKIHKAEGTVHDLIVSDADMNGTDWVVIS